MSDEGFSARLTLALKALSLSRGRLSADLAVDKSVISRWLNGRQAPSGQNLVNLTELIASKRPGFSVLDWDADIEAFSAKVLGEQADTNMPWGAFGTWVPEAVLIESRAITDLRGEAYEGFWRTTRMATGASGRFVHDEVMIRRAPNGLLTFRSGVEDMRFEGWAFLAQTQIFAFGSDARTGLFVFLMLNAVMRHRAEVLDGLSLACQRVGGGTPFAAPILMERTGMLSGDMATDEVAYEASIPANPLAPEGSISPRIRDHLFRDVGPAALAAGGAALLAMPFNTSFSRGPLSDTEAAALAASDFA